MSENNKVQHFGLKWIMANAIAWVIGYGIWGNLSEGILLSLGFGLTMGLAQVYSLPQLEKPGRWIGANIIGWLSGFVVATGLIYISPVTSLGQLPSRELLFLSVWGFAGGVFSALLQCLWYQQIVPIKTTTIFVFATSTGVAGFASHFVMTTGLNYLANQYTSQTWILWHIATLIISGMIFGVITIIPITQIWQVSLPHQKL